YTYQWANLTSPTTPYLIDSQEVAWVFPPVNSSYEVTATDSSGCFVSYTKLVRRVELPQYTMDSVVLACPGDSAWIGPSSFLFSDLNLWMNGDTDFPRREIKTGWHSFYAIHENVCEIHDSVYLGNHLSPQLEEVPADTNLCPGTKYFINTSLGSRPFTYEWNGIQTAIPRTISQSEWVNLVVKDKHGCRDSATFQLWVNEKPNLIFSSGPNMEFCRGDSVEVKVLNAPSNASLNWSGFSGSDIKIYYPGMYVLNLTDSISCTYTYTVFGVEWPAPDAGFTYQAQAGGVAFTPDRLNVNHTWFFGDGNTSNNGLPVHHYAQAGIYLVKHYASESEHGCWASDSLAIVVTGLEDLEQWGISIFPNPFKENFVISYPAGAEPYPVQLLDMQGKMIPILSKEEENRLSVYGLENLAPGTYILRILSPGGSVETRIQKRY
ncbi:MAG: T9SS type A sorting domain-containing protein, partial [Bacteroidia bacterium]